MRLGTLLLIIIIVLLVLFLFSRRRGRLQRTRSSPPGVRMQPVFPGGANGPPGGQLTSAITSSEMSKLA